LPAQKDSHSATQKAAARISVTREVHAGLASAFATKDSWEMIAQPDQEFQDEYDNKQQFIIQQCILL